MPSGILKSLRDDTVIARIQSGSNVMLSIHAYMVQCQQAIGPIDPISLNDTVASI